MRDKLLKILKTRIDAINRNIDNLNYLNSELEKNASDLNYIQDKIDIFAANNILNFDSLSLDDFEKVLSMIDPSVAEVFQDKTCNYQGIMYIIQGIRQGISLELTDEQANAIRMLIQEMINKKASLEDVIANLNESKSRLSETEMSILTSNLKKFQTIISKIEQNLYITEVEEIISSLEFSNVSLEEKVGIFEFILKYNTKIYVNNQTPITDTINDEEFSLKEINVPEFHYEPINIYDEDKEEKEVEENHEDKFVNLEKTSQIPVNFKTYDEDKKEEVKEAIAEEVKKEEPENVVEPKEETPSIENIPLPTFTPYEDKTMEIMPSFETIEPTNIVPSTDIPVPPTPSIEVQPVEPVEITPPVPEVKEEPMGAETAELEDIIGKIDAKLKAMEQEPKEVPSTSDAPVISSPIITPPDFNTNKSEELNAIFNRFALNKNMFTSLGDVDNSEVESILATLNEKQLLDSLRENPETLELAIKLKKENFDKLFKVIEENFVNKDITLQNVLDDIAETMPVLLTSTTAIDNFALNITFFKNNNLDIIDLYNNYKEIFLLDNTLLQERLAKVKYYKLTLTNDNIKYLLYNKNVLDNLDYYIEAKGSEKGFLGREEDFDGYDCVVKNPYKLNNISRDVLIKLRYATENNKKIFGSKQGILSGEISNSKVDSLIVPIEYKNLYFDNEYSIIDKNKLSELMQELSARQEINMASSPAIETLDSKYKLDDLRYKIGDLTFSRMKTIRLYNFLIEKQVPASNALIVALTYNSVIKRDEYSKLESIISSIVEGGN